jgi:hypothetical protein
VHLERLPVAVVVHQDRRRERLDPRRAREVVVERALRLAEAEHALRLLLLVREEPLRVRAPLVELRFELDRDVVVKLQRRHRAGERVARAVRRDAGDEAIAGLRRERSVGERVHRHDHAVHEHGDRVGVVDEIARVPRADLHGGEELGRRPARSMRAGRHGRDDVEVARAATRDQVELERQRARRREVLPRRHGGVNHERRAHAELLRVELRERKRRLEPSMPGEFERLRERAERRRAGTRADRAAGLGRRARRIRVRRRQRVQRVVDDLLAHGGAPLG